MGREFIISLNFCSLSRMALSPFTLLVISRTMAMRDCDNPLKLVSTQRILSFNSISTGSLS